jgi:hypothetical protein
MAYPSRLDGLSRDLLLGREQESLADLDAEYAALGRPQIRSAMRNALGSMVLVIPETGFTPNRTFHPYPSTWAGSPGDARTFVPMYKRPNRPWQKATAPGPRLSIGTVGIVLDGPNGDRLIGIRWSDCVALISEKPDGPRILARDGYTMMVPAAEWKDGPEALALIDRFGPARVAVPAPA